MENTQQTLGRILNALSLMNQGLESALLDPLLHLLLVLLSILITHTLITDNETTHIQTLGQHIGDVLDRVTTAIVLRDHTAHDDTTEIVHRVQRSLKVLTTNILVVDIQTLGGQTGQRISRLLGLVVETTVEAKLLGDEVELLVRSDGSNDLQTLVLGELADQLADSATGSGDEDGLALLGLTDLVEGGVGSQTGHAEGADEDADVLDAEGVLEGADAGQLVSGDGDVLLDGEEADDQVALLVGGSVGAEDLADDAAVDGSVEGEGGGVGLDVGGAHAAAHVGIEAGIEGLHEDATLRGRGGGVVRGLLEDDVLAGDEVAGGDLLEDEALVGHGDCGVSFTWSVWRDML